jgi:hypothetical protein
MSYKYTFCLLAVLTTAADAYGQTLEESQALDLGRIAVIDNDSVGTIFINKDSFTSVSGGVRILTTGRPAIFEARGFDSNRRLFISVQPNQAGTVTSDVSQEQFTVEAYDAEEFITTDAQGNADFVVGARFATSGSGSENFRDTVYSATYTVTVNY